MTGQEFAAAHDAWSAAKKKLVDDFALFHEPIPVAALKRRQLAHYLQDRGMSRYWKDYARVELWLHYNRNPPSWVATPSLAAQRRYHEEPTYEQPRDLDQYTPGDEAGYIDPYTGRPTRPPVTADRWHANRRDVLEQVKAGHVPAQKTYTIQSKGYRKRGTPGEYQRKLAAALAEWQRGHPEPKR